MDTTNPPANPSEAGHTVAPHPGHETRDVNLRLIVISLVGLSILIILVFLIVGGLLAFLTNLEVGQIVPLPPLAVDQQPPEPRLQPSPAEDLQILRAEEDAILSNYGWVNEEAEVVRLPIERAMELTLERGLPAREGE